MHSLITLAALFGSIASCQCQGDFSFKAPTYADRRSPCPMVNTLANHGYLPRNGLGVTMDDLIRGFNASVNLAEAATRFVGAKALTASTTGNSSTFNLDDLNTHNIIEHDGSLSRSDIFFGDNHSFNETVWAATAAHFTADTITIETAAAARAERLRAAAAANPEFNMTASQVQSSFIETALYLSVFGSVTDGNAVTKHVKVLFQEERLPIEEGWQRPSSQLTAAGILGMVQKVAAATPSS